MAFSAARAGSAGQERGEGRASRAAAAGFPALVRAPCVAAPKMRRPRHGGSGGGGAAGRGLAERGLGRRSWTGREKGLALGEPCAALRGGAEARGGRRGRGAPPLRHRGPCEPPRAGRWKRIQPLAPFVQLLLRHFQALPGAKTAARGKGQLSLTGFHFLCRVS